MAIEAIASVMFVRVKKPLIFLEIRKLKAPALPFVLTDNHGIFVARRGAKLFGIFAQAVLE